ncbi:hypothetical protein AQUCO_03700326v1 [Aquilegia coerulea]|uniref:DUF599 domain-containing protein n=1 Tax=Aquilegia coerulea TaxID=218851 RepID=A0A2G5CUP5_AQUCA|nr:hypothetical protein AQUCO_03700326v1 [Aquilegia coerulea]
MNIEEQLDYVLVPLGLVIMLVYHLWLVYNIVYHPRKTVIGINSINTKIWVHTMMEDTVKNGVCAVQTLRNNMMASTHLASTSIMFISVITVLMTNTSTGIDHGLSLYGNKRELGLSIKLFSILACIFLALLLNIQSFRYYSDASILVNMVGTKSCSSSSDDDDHFCSSSSTANKKYIWMTVNMGSYFWSLGLRSFYFSFPIFMWLFGPIPMFLCSILLVIMLYFLDIYLDPGTSNNNIGGEVNDAEKGSD